jgi:hypothetical protein
MGSELEMCVGSCVHLVGVSISFEKNFIGSHSLPPLWFAVSVLQYTNMKNIYIESNIHIVQYIGFPI